MSAVALLNEIRAAGIAVNVDGDRLHVEARPGTITPELRDQMKAHKPELVAILRTRARLLELAELELIDLALVHRQTDADLATLTGEHDRVLAAYLHALVTADEMDRGLAPEGYTAAVYCEGCGPVLLWPECPSTVKACPWCFRRKAGKPIPRPLVTCATCRHFEPDPINAAGGIGSCAHGLRSCTPMLRHRCDGWAPLEDHQAQG